MDKSGSAKMKRDERGGEMKPCPWYKGKSGSPDLKLCKKCVYKVHCVGRNFPKKEQSKDGLTLEETQEILNKLITTQQQEGFMEIKTDEKG